MGNWQDGVVDEIIKRNQKAAGIDYEDRIPSTLCLRYALEPSKLTPAETQQIEELAERNSRVKNDIERARKNRICFLGSPSLAG